MASRGRPRKAGRRLKDKRERLVPVTVFDKGTERAQAMRVFYGPDCADAIGRAYQSGLLGNGDTAKNLLDTARTIARAYWHHFSTGTYRCAIGDRVAGSIFEIDHERDKRREEWLRANLRAVEAMGYRREFDQLVIDINPDEGPGWLDRLIAYERQGTPGMVSDIAALNRAVEALSHIAGE